jgi:DNA polymerase III epsilon subunit-like protein
MARYAMVDLETLSTNLNAAILTLGAVVFDPFDSTKPMQELYLRIELEDQESAGAIIDSSTLEWWSKQSPEIIEEAFGPENRIPIADAMKQFRKFVWNCDKIWSHGATYDLIILQLVFDRLKMPYPWSYYNMRDTRSIFALGIDPAMPQAQKHNALEDAKRQAIGVSNVYKQLIALGLTPDDYKK